MKPEHLCGPAPEYASVTREAWLSQRVRVLESEVARLAERLHRAELARDVNAAGWAESARQRDRARVTATSFEAALWQERGGA